jgi:thiaminase (transcriptional activator TenA)
MTLSSDYLIGVNALAPEELRRQLRNEHEQVTGFADELRHEFDDIWRQIDQHPFLVELDQRKLPLDKYKVYAVQNAYYIADHVRSVGRAISKAEPLHYAFIFGRLIQLVPGYGTPVFAFPKIAKAVGVTDKDFEEIMRTPSLVMPGTQAYVDFMYKMYEIGTPGIAAASYVACPWTYTERELGGLDCAKRVAEGLDKYGVSKELIQAYTDEEGFSDWHMRLLRITKDIINAEANVPEVRERMRDAFRRNSEFELGFWDQAYRYDSKS